MRKGMTLIEVLTAAMVLVTVITGMALFQTATLKTTSAEKDRAFAMQKAIQIMEEVLAYQVTAGTDPATGVDTLSDGAGYNYALTISQRITAPTDVLSGNTQLNGQYRFVRQIAVEPLSNDRGARRVTVSVAYADGTAVPGALVGKPVLASVVNIVKAGAVKSQPTQVYDLYILGVENVGGNRYTLEQMVMNTLDQVKLNNPGLDFRIHYLRKLAYGRDPYYSPAFERAGWVFDYSGYNPAYLGGQLLKAAGRANPLSIGTQAGNYPTQQANYAFADHFNQAMRLPEEEEKYAANPGQEMTVRMFLERMAKGELKNAMVINFHEEWFPMVPLRNYADAAKVPSYPGQAAYVRDHFGLTPSSDAEMADGSRARLVVHPRRLSVSTDGSYNPSRDGFSNANTVELDVFPYLSRNTTVEPPARYRTIQIVLRGAANDLTDWNATRHSGNDENIEIQAMQRLAGNTEPAGSGFPLKGYYVRYSSGAYRMYSGTDATYPGYHWQRVWPDSEYLNHDDYRSLGLGYNPELARYHDVDVRLVTRDDTNRNLKANDVVITLKNVPYTNNPMNVGGRWYGLPNAAANGAANARNLYGYNYMPDAKLPYMDDDWPNHPTSGAQLYAPRNTARFRIRFKVRNAGRYEVFSTIGDDDDLRAHQFPNQSRTWFWAGMAPPFSERYQFTGDPRCVPYEDARYNSGGATQGNRYFEDLNANAYKGMSGSGQAYARYPGTVDGWGPQTRQGDDIPRYFELWRQAILGSTAIFQNPIGFSFWHLSLGSDDAALIEKTDNSWHAVPWLGELYPDDQWPSWLQYGNLPTSAFRHVAASGVPSWKPDGSANTDWDGATKDKGSVAFFNGGTSGNESNWFTHYYSDLMADRSVYGDAMSQGLKLSLDDTLRSRRAYRIDATDMNPPEDYGSAENDGWRTRLEFGIPGATHGYYTIDNDKEAVAPFVIKRGTQAGYAVMVTGHWADYSGSTLLARLCVASLMQTFFDMGNQNFANGSARRDLAIKQLPLVHVSAPADDSTIGTRNFDVTWDRAWTRWDGTDYSRFATTSSYTSNPYRPDLGYVVKYSTDGGYTWRFINSNVPTKRGEWVAGEATTATSMRWDTSRLPNFREYVVRVEGFRREAGYESTHYAFHQVPVTMAHP